jgi:hypothetical protein
MEHSTWDTADTARQLATRRGRLSVMYITEAGKRPNKLTDMFWGDEKRCVREPIDNTHKKPL